MTIHHELEFARRVKAMVEIAPDPATLDLVAYVIREFAGPLPIPFRQGALALTDAMARAGAILRDQAACKLHAGSDQSDQAARKL